MLHEYYFSKEEMIFAAGTFNAVSQITEIFVSDSEFSSLGNFCQTTNMAASTNMDSKERVTPVYLGTLITLLNS